MKTHPHSLLALGLAVGLMFLCPPRAYPGAIVLKVTAAVVNVRSAPDSNSAALSQERAGALIEAERKTGEWYELYVTLADGRIVKGYIRQELVQEVGGTPAPPPPRGAAGRASPPPPAPGLPAGPVGPVKKNPFSGFFFKLGVPKFGTPDWLGGLGYDLGLGRNLALGIEIAPSSFAISYPDQFPPFENSVTSVFGIANVKAGTGLGFLRPDLDFVRVFASGGGGMAAIHMKMTEGTTSASFTHYNPVLNLGGGFELGAGSWSLIFEYRLFRLMEKNIAPNGWSGYFSFGIRL